MCRVIRALVPAPFDIADPDAVARYAQQQFQAGRAMGTIIRALNMWGVPCDGPQWNRATVKALLLDDRHQRAVSQGRKK